MTVSRNINFDESIHRMIERLKSEHVIFESNLVQIENSIKMNNIKIEQAKELERETWERKSSNTQLKRKSGLCVL